MKQKVTIKIKKGLPNLLQTVRLIKIHSGISLKPAKDIVDRLMKSENNVETIEIDYKSFINDIRGYGLDNFIIVSKYDRDLKLIELVGTNEDYVNFISENYIFIEDNERFLKTILKN